MSKSLKSAFLLGAMCAAFGPCSDARQYSQPPLSASFEDLPLDLLHLLCDYLDAKSAKRTSANARFYKEAIVAARLGYTKRAIQTSNIDEFLHCASLCNLDQNILVARFECFLAVTKAKHLETWSALFTRRLNLDESTPEKLPDFQRCITALINNPDVNATQCNGCTLLQVAIYKRDETIINFLLAYGANPTVQTNRDCTHIELARNKGYEHLAQLLEEHVRAPRSAG